MDTYEIINMSDKLTCQSDNDNVAAIAILLLGNGAYGLESQKGESVLPLMLFAGEEACKELIAKHTGELTLSEYIEANKEQVAACLDSVMTVGFSERMAFDEALTLIDDQAKREQWRASYHDRNRTSMNDIAGRAWKMAKAMRRKVAAA